MVPGEEEGLGLTAGRGLQTAIHRALNYRGILDVEI
jgi:hypothetical protein